MAKYGLGRHHAATEVDHDGLILPLNPAKYGGITILGVGIMFITGAMFTGDTVTMEPLFSVENGVIFGIMMVMIMLPFMFVGFDVILQAVEEVNLPFREIGRVLMLSVLMAVFWYALIIYGTSMMLTPVAMAQSSLAVPDAMQAVFNAPWAGKLMVFAGIAGIITSSNAFYIGGFRAIYALAHSGMPPAFLAKLHPEYKTPVNGNGWCLPAGYCSVWACMPGRASAMV